jgi:hypothetical protein
MSCVTSCGKTEIVALNGGLSGVPGEWGMGVAKWLKSQRNEKNCSKIS